MASEGNAQYFLLLLEDVGHAHISYACHTVWLYTGINTLGAPECVRMCMGM